MDGRIITTARLMMGVIYVVSGLNWWFKMITPYPSISDFVSSPPPPDMVGEMIKTGVLFHIVKGTELLAGLALLGNRFVPLMLVAVLPITINIAIVDVFFIAHLRGIVMGSGSFILNIFLMLAYIGHYRGVLTVRATPDLAGEAAPVDDSSSVAPALARGLSRIMPFFGAFAILMAVAMLYFVTTLMIQYAQNPLPLSALHPPSPPPAH
ncbi:MAG: DoxX family membrane protein [Sphingobium sp.]|nr:DoxX family membrane protein [Sphingobium sp.]MBP8670384.1 DoxX family membrane protein [Sphingobium sp.]MBP9157514.1 DoxX family membrane protein [Sphingobium sp.]MCC6482119.1 DoxX family membrane protein [Sphingomonadaceae bacterium]